MNPIVGHTKRDDFLPHVILDGYQAMLDYGIYPAGKVVLASFTTCPRFAGPVRRCLPRYAARTWVAAISCRARSFRCR
ncbi:hypothetical protein [Ensifer adhaerens]|uniref:hypothetical protein n=1 Tax=Ensifer adhaerens TaxID=106592 RepID=UPI003AF367E3